MRNSSQTLIWSQQIEPSQVLNITTRLKSSPAPGVVYFEWLGDDSMTVETGPLNVWFLENVVVSSSPNLDLLCNASWDPLPVDELNPPYQREVAAEQHPGKVFGSTGQQPAPEPTSIFIEEECYILPGFCSFHMGHFITEYLPRLLVLCGFAKISNKRLPLYISRATPEYLVDSFRCILDDNGIELKLFGDCKLTTFSKAITAPYADYLESGHIGYHPVCAKLIQDFLEKRIDALGGSSIAGNESEPWHKIYISRKHDSGYISPVAPRTIVNEDEVIQALAETGFLIIRMEDLGLNEKILLMSKCKVMIGGWGTGLLNCIFSPPKAIVASLGIGFNSDLAKISNLKNHRHYEIPTFNPDHPSEMIMYIRGESQYVDINLLKGFLVAHGLD